MMYTTRLYGAPYGADGERGDDTEAPADYAERILCAGQEMECFAGGDEAHLGATVIRRYVADAQGVVSEVEL